MKNIEMRKFRRIGSRERACMLLNVALFHPI